MNRPIGKSRGKSFALLSHLRWLAALLVAYSHVRQTLLVDYPHIAHPNFAAKGIYWIAAYGHAGVVVFFVLSGFLVGGKALDLAASKDIEQEWPKFLVDRYVRIFIVLWPALLLSSIIFFALIKLVPAAPFVSQPKWGWDLQLPLDIDRSYLNWIGAVTLMNDFFTPTLRIDAPLWSLAYEWFYYILILAVVLVYRRVWSKAGCVVIVYAVMLLCVSLLRSPVIAESGLIWLFGMASRVIFNRCLLRGRWLQPTATVVVVIVLLVSRLQHVPDYVLGVSVAFLIAIHDWADWHGAEKIGESLASFSYSLYVVHFPILLGIMGFLFAEGDLSTRLPFQSFGVTTVAIVLLLTIAFAKIFAQATENHTRTVRNFILKLLQSKQPMVISKEKSHGERSVDPY